MSRLRARTWTPVERECMEWYLHWSTPPDGIEGTRNAVGDWNMGCAARTSTVQAMAVFQVIDAAERIMRTKGYAAGRLTPRHYSRGKWRHATDRGNRALESYHANRKYPFRPQRRYIHMVNIGTPNGPAWYRGGIWVSSGSNPNILVRQYTPTPATITKMEIRPADAPEGTPWEVLS